MAKFIQEKMKVLFCIDALARGGTELQLVGLIDRLDRDKFEPILCTIRPNPKEMIPHNCRHLAIDIPRLFSPKGLHSMWKFSRMMQDENIAVVHTFFQDSTIFAGFAARLAGVPVRLASFRDLGFWRTPGQEAILRRVFPLMTGFLANSQGVKDHFVQSDGIDPERIKVIFNGVDVLRLPFIDHRGPTLDIGIVGNLNRKVKRTDLFIEAAGLVASAHPEVTWHILGEGKYKKNFQNLAGRLGLKEKVIFAGKVVDVPKYLSGMQVGVNCSDSEGFSNALLEYMLMGCAAVATAVGGNAEALENGNTGLLVPPNDPLALASAISKIIENIPLRRKLAANARCFAEKKYSWDQCIDAHEAVYRADSWTSPGCIDTP